ncbi:MAG: hypothetical protein ACSLEX_04190 [Minisyncoccota bacterium]
MLQIERSLENPLLLPNTQHTWEDLAVFNGSPIQDDSMLHMFYRALGRPEYHHGAFVALSTIGKTSSTDGIHFGEHVPFIVPEELWERYGCEDPRITRLDNRFYIFYTALSTYPFSPAGISVGLAITDDLQIITEKHHITPFNSKAMTLFPEKIGGKYAVLLSVNTDQPPTSIALALFDNIEDMWSQENWQHWYASLPDHVLNLHKQAGDHVEIGAVPIKTSHGWLLIYSHIYQYGMPEQVFGIEAVLLDIHNPQKIIGRTDTPLLVPQEEYERYGMVPNIIFPSGAWVEGEDALHIYYGASDTTLCRATTSLADLLNAILRPKKNLRFQRSSANPIMMPLPEHPWESKLVFNPTVIHEDGMTHIIYRAAGADDTSVFGYATTRDGVTINERLPEPIYVPRAPFEQKYHPGNSGCEDPRITRIDDIYYLCYTAFDGNNPPRVALTHITVDDFHARRFDRWSYPILISPPGIDDKDAALFPEKINGKYVFLHRIQPSIDIHSIDTLNIFDGEHFLMRNPLLSPRIGMWDDLKIGLSSVPIKTPVGWLLLYHGVSSIDHHYRVGAALLDLHEPEKVIGRTHSPLLEPEMPYEKEGEVPNVVFPCGSFLIGDDLIIYYGGADTVIGTASISLSALLASLQ